MSNLTPILKADGTNRCILKVTVDFNMEDGHVNHATVRHTQIQPTIEFIEQYRLFNVAGQLSPLGVEVFTTGSISAMLNAVNWADKNSVFPLGLSMHYILKGLMKSTEEELPPHKVMCLLMMIEPSTGEFYKVGYYDEQLEQWFESGPTGDIMGEVIEGVEGFVQLPSL